MSTSADDRWKIHGVVDGTPHREKNDADNKQGYARREPGLPFVDTTLHHIIE